MKIKSVKTWIGRIISSILFIFLMLMIVFVLYSKTSNGPPQIFGYQLKTVLSGSMEPDIKTGSIIALKTGDDMTRFQENDVITFVQEMNPGGEGTILVTHRITEVLKSGDEVMYKTKGDNNDGEDMNPVLAKNVVAIYTGVSIPYIGYVANFAQSKQGNIYLIILPGFLILGYAIIGIWRTISQIEVVKETDGKDESSV